MVTQAYNEALSEILPGVGVSVQVMPRLTIDGDIVSASKVRDHIREDNWEKIRCMVPTITYDFLQSKDAEGIITHIKQSRSRH
jgi:[citrate (pro-3S)-lyase] ligase